MTVYENGNAALAHKKSAVSVFFKYLYRDGLVEKNITDGFDPIRLPKPGERVIKALADDVEYELEQIGVHDGHIEGRATGWVLLDYGAVLVHVFDKESRAYYNLERLWTDANLVDISDIIKD